MAKLSKIYNSIVEVLKKLLKKTLEINYERTLFSKKETKRFLKSLNETTIQAKILERGLYGGGCPAPDAIVKTGLSRG